MHLENNPTACINYSTYLHEDFLTRSYLNLIYSNIFLNNSFSNLLFKDVFQFMSSSFFDRPNVDVSTSIPLTPWTHELKNNLFLKNKLLNKQKLILSSTSQINTDSLYNKKIKKNSFSFLDKKALVNYNKLYLSFFLNKQKYNIKLILFLFKNIYEIRKRIYLINITLAFFHELYKNNDINSENYLLKKEHSKDNKIFLKRDFWLKKNKKDYLNFLDNSGSKTSLGRIKNKKAVRIKKNNLPYLNNQYIKILNSLEKNYWMKYKYDINWLIHNKNLYYIKTKIFNSIKYPFFKESQLTIFNNNYFTLIQKNNNKSYACPNIFIILGSIYKLLCSVDSVDSLDSTDLGNSINLVPESKETCDKKKIKKGSIYYLHLILIKIFYINIWKYFLSLRDIKIHKHYNFFIINHIIKSLNFQIYTKLDRYLLIKDIPLKKNKDAFNILNFFKHSFSQNLLKNNNLSSIPSSGYKKIKDIISKDKKDIKKGDILYLCMLKHLENIYLMKNISINLSLRTEFNSFMINETKINKNSLTAKSESLIRSRPMDKKISYILKPLIFNNTLDSPSFFDKNYERNAFYLSKIKDISNPILFSNFTYPGQEVFFNIPEKGEIKNAVSKKDKIKKWIAQYEKNKDSHQKEGQNVINQKNLSSIQINTGPRILLKKSNNKLNIEWQVNAGLSLIDINKYKKIYKKYALANINENNINIEKVRNKEIKKINNNYKNLFENATDEALRKGIKIESRKEVILNRNFNLNKINLERKSIFEWIFTYKKKRKQAIKTINAIRIEENKNLRNIFCFEKKYASPIINIISSPQAIKPFELIDIKNKINKILALSFLDKKERNNVNWKKINLTPLLKSIDASSIEIKKSYWINNPKNNKNFSFYKEIKKDKNNYKYLPLPKAPINDFNYQYLRKIKQGDKKEININIKHYYTKTHSAQNLIENLSRFLISFIKKNKGGKNKFQQLKNITYRALQSQISNNYKGIGFRFSGRVYGAKKAMQYKMLFGSVPFSSLKANIDYANLMQKTKNGTWGFQTWLHLKEKKLSSTFPLNRIYTEKEIWMKNADAIRHVSQEKLKKKYLTPFLIE